MRPGLLFVVYATGEIPGRSRVGGLPDLPQFCRLRAHLRLRACVFPGLRPVCFRVSVLRVPASPSCVLLCLRPVCFRVSVLRVPASPFCVLLCLRPACFRVSVLRVSASPSRVFPRLRPACSRVSPAPRPRLPRSSGPSPPAGVRHHSRLWESEHGHCGLLCIRLKTENGLRMWKPFSVSDSVAGWLSA